MSGDGSVEVTIAHNYLFTNYFKLLLVLVSFVISQ